jgi:BRCT domain type II-containing protein
MNGGLNSVALKFINEDTGKLKEAVFCFTGKFPKPRYEMQAIALNAGAEVTNAVTNKTTILVIADANSKSVKAKKARSMSIDLISPSQFFMMCGAVTASNGNGQISQVRIKKPKPTTKPTEKRKHSSVRRIEL